MCGKDGYKISKGTPLRDKDGNKVVAYICPYRKPLDYYALKDKSGKLIRSVFSEDKDKITPDTKAGETLEPIKYEGCPYWNKSHTNIDSFFD